MAQLHRDFVKFQEEDAIIVVVGPEDDLAFRNYWNQEKLPFVGLPDPEHIVLNLYKQKVNLFKLGRMPAQMLIDKKGIIQYVHYGDSMMDIPSNEEIIKLLQELNQV